LGELITYNIKYSFPEVATARLGGYGDRRRYRSQASWLAIACQKKQTRGAGECSFGDNETDDIRQPRMKGGPALLKKAATEATAIPFGRDASGAQDGWTPVVQLIGYAAGPEFKLEDVPARTEPEATSPETDTPARLFAEICYLLYQGPVPGDSPIYRFSTGSFGFLLVT
jgi:hypothetical protein